MMNYGWNRHAVVAFGLLGFWRGFFLSKLVGGKGSESREWLFISIDEFVLTAVTNNIQIVFLDNNSIFRSFDFRPKNTILSWG